jgi:hypothetical protein
MEKKEYSSETLRAVLIAVPAVLVSILVLAAALLRLAYQDAAWLGALGWSAAVIAAVNPGVLLLLAPLLRVFSKAAGGYLVREAVTVPGVGRPTLDRSASIAIAKAGGGIASCLRAYCGDVGAPPDKFAEMEGLGASAQFSGQMIHAGNINYMRGLKVEAPEVPGEAVYVALEGRLLGYYSLFGPEQTRKMKKRLLAAITICAALKIIVWSALAFTGTDYLSIYVGCETASLTAGLTAARWFFK